MGFDLECIIDIHSYPGEYFCPVCRTLVYPSDAFQAQCTHLYCKQCLVHIANGSKTCPYDGYLVTESDSKPLAECDKALTEKVGKVKVHCLYFRSGCTWEGTLSDCPSHCSGCSFGNSPVICNRCGIQIVHRQVHEHAKICPGGYDGQQTVVGTAGLMKSCTTSTPVTAQVNQTIAQSGAPVPPPQNMQNANMQGNASAHVPVVAPAPMPALDQWYQHQYQQYYQQYGGYDPYQQQQYYPLQQLPFQQYQQHAVQVQGQHQPQAQPQGPKLQLQPPEQTNSATEASQQPQLQLQAQGLAQPLPQTQLQMLPQAPAQTKTQGQTQSQVNAPVQALPTNYHVNPQQQTHTAMRPQTQIPLQGLPPPPPPHGPPSLPPQFPQAVGMLPPAHPQHQQVPQYQQVQGHIHNPQGSQAHLQLPMHPQAQSYVQPSSQPNAQSQPQTQLYQSHSQLPVFHSQANQTAPPALLHASNPPAPPVSGHHSYPQPQTTQQMQPVAPQQHVVLPQPPSESIHQVQVYGQVPQQATHIRPPHSHGSFSQKQPSDPPAPHQQFLPYGLQPTLPFQHRPAIQPVQQAAPHNYAQQQQFSAPFQGPSHHQQGPVPLQPPMQSQMQMQMHPSGPHQPQQSQNSVGMPMMPNQEISSESHLLPAAGYGASGHYGPTHWDSTSSQNYAKSALLDQNATVQEIRSPSKVLAENGFKADSLKEEVGMELNGSIVKDVDDSVKIGLVKSVIKQEKSDVGSREPENEGNLSGVGAVENETRKEDVRKLSDFVPLKQVNPDSLMNLLKTVGLSSGSFVDETISANSVSRAEGCTLPPQSHGSVQEMSNARPSSALGLQGPGAFPHPGQPVNSTEGKVSVNLGGAPKSFESPADARDFIGKPPPLPFESQFGSQHVVRPGEVAISSNQMSGSGQWRLLTKINAGEPHHLRMNVGGAHKPSMFGTRDVNSKPLSKEHSNPFERERSHTFDPASKSLDKPLHGHGYNAASKLDSGVSDPHSRPLLHHPSGGRGDMFGPGPEFEHHNIKPFPYRSPGRNYLGSPSRGFGGRSSFPRGTGFEDINSREAHRSGEGSRSSNLSSDFVRKPFHDGRFPPLPGHLRRGGIDDPGNPRFGEQRLPGSLHNQIGGGDVFAPDGPGHLMKGKFSGPGYSTGHFNMGETSRPGNLPSHGREGEGTGYFPRPPFSESVRGNMPNFLHHGEPPMRNNYPNHGMPNAADLSGKVDPFEQSRKRKPLSNGWCRICEFDCETVEQLEIHSQTREHQNMAMDMVKHIKLQNKKKQRSAGGRMVHEGSRTRKGGSVERGNKP